MMAYVPPHKRGALKEEQGSSNREQPRGRPWGTAETRRSIPKQNQDRSAYNTNEQLPGVFDQITFYYCINLSERPDKWRAFQKRAANVHPSFCERIKRFDAVNGQLVLSQNRCNENYVTLLWDASLNAKYSRRIHPGPKTMTSGEVGCALSHIELWKTLASKEKAGEADAVMMVLEDDAVFSWADGKSRFADVLTQALEIVPSDWGILYLGFSARGQRQFIETEATDSNRKRFETKCKVELFRPEYGYHTHAYLITQQAALTLLNHLPVQGPIDVWLADNKWFDLSVYSAVIADEGWKREDGTFEGAVLVSQDRGHGNRSDVRQSSLRGERFDKRTL